MSITEPLQLAFDTPHLCECGCGQPTQLATYTKAKDGIICGKPLRFINWHSGRLPRRKRYTVEQRFWNMVRKTDDCWEWLGATNTFGYGKLNVDHKIVPAHRFSWEIHFGSISDGLWVLHKCDNPPCCNPAHLFLGTCADNHKDMVEKRRSTIGERNPQARLTEALVLRIRAEYRQHGVSHVQLAKKYGVSAGTIDDLLAERTWSHLK
jgi:hypothetical protein